MLAEMISILPPPANPTHASGDWARVEKDLGIELPSDYKAIVRTYGYGSYCDSLSLLNPFTDNKVTKTIAAIIQQWQQISDLCAVEYPFYPDRGGLLPCAVNVNGNYVSWKTDGSPEEWEIVVWDTSEVRYVTFQGPLSTFLHSLLTRESALTSLLLTSLAYQPGRAPWFTQWQIDAVTGEEKPLLSS